MNSNVALLTDHIGDALAECARDGRHHLTLVAPFVKRNALERVLAQADPRLVLTVFTRWDVAEIAAGVSDLNILDFFVERGNARLFLHPRLHAKLLLVDDRMAALGSANITAAALGFDSKPNIEMMAILQPVPNRVFQFLRHLEREAIPATEELRRLFEQAASNSPPACEPPAVPVSFDPRPASGHFPGFRDPERLYSGYLSVAQFNDNETRAAILDDLATLGLPDELDEATFRQQVGARLLAEATVAAFDEFVAKPQFFGEMADWLKTRGVLADASQDDRKRYLQTLVRWLRHFLPGRYRLEEPNYSELFGQAEGWNA